MYSFVAVLLVAASSFQGRAQAASSADALYDKYLNSLYLYLDGLPNSVVKAWPAFSAHELRTTDLARSFENWFNQLNTAWMSGTCVDQLKDAYTALKTQAINAFANCANSLWPSIDKAEINQAIDDLRTLDNQIQKIGNQCDNNNNMWAKRWCMMGLRGQIMSLYMTARFQRVIPVYEDARQAMIAKGYELVSCVSQSTPGMINQIVANMDKFSQCFSGNN